MRRCGTPISFASRYCVIPIGLRNSSRRISPGVGRYAFLPISLVIPAFDIAK